MLKLDPAFSPLQSFTAFQRETIAYGPPAAASAMQVQVIIDTLLQSAYAAAAATRP